MHACVHQAGGGGDPLDHPDGTHRPHGRVERAGASRAVGGVEDAAKFASVPGDYAVVYVPGVRAGSEPVAAPELPHRTCLDYRDAYASSDELEPDSPTGGDATLLLYFTSGTTSTPKLVEHTHTSYPVGHLSTMYWIGLEPGNIVSVDENGVFSYMGRSDDVFKSNDYKISPFELESVLVEHPAVLEAAIVPTPDELRLAVPKACVTPAPGRMADVATATEILAYCRTTVAPYKRIRRIEFLELPKTISGKIRRVELRSVETRRSKSGRAPEGHGTEYREEDLSLDQ